jgi:ABC-type uncharacterized transport system substrate-binding protein
MTSSSKLNCALNFRTKLRIHRQNGTASARANAVEFGQASLNSLPIVFAAAGDPVGTGLVASLSRPGGNVTGLSNQSADLAGKRQELLCEIVPTLGRLAIMFNAGSTIGVLEKDQVQMVARALRLEVVPLEIREIVESDSAHLSTMHGYLSI